MHLKIYMILWMFYGEGNGSPLQYSCLENPVDRETWWAAVHRVAQSQTWLKWLSMHACIGEGNGNPLQYSCLENPGAEEPGGLLSMGLHRIGHDWSDLAAAWMFKQRVDKILEDIWKTEKMNLLQKQSWTGEELYSEVARVGIQYLE